MTITKTWVLITLITFSFFNGWSQDRQSKTVKGKQPKPTTTVIQLTLGFSETGPMIPDDFIGIGYEKTLLSKPGIFTPENTVLRRLMTNLGKGNLRIGANGADIAVWSRMARTDSTGEKVVTSDDLDHFYAFVKETDWNVVHALNLRTSTPQIGADEAEYVAKIAGNKLVAFEIGNEPDLKMRDRYKVTDYIREFRAFTEAVKQKVPEAKFVGPGATYWPSQDFWTLTRGVDEWAVPFAKEAGNEIVQLTHHIYILGQPYRTQPEENYLATIPNLLGSMAKENYIPVLKKLALAAERAGVPYRINEGNSCYHGGKDSVSNTFASALWVTDYLFTLATYGASGANFHGGTHFYSPIETRGADQSKARPMYYGLLMFNACSKGRLIPTKVVNDSKLEISSYATLAGDGSAAVAIINREGNTDVTIQLDATRYYTHAKIMRLEGSSLDSKTGVKFGGSIVASDGSWMPIANEIVKREGRIFTIRVPAASGVAILLEKDPVSPESLRY